MNFLYLFFLFCSVLALPRKLHAVGSVSKQTKTQVNTQASGRASAKESDPIKDPFQYLSVTNLDNGIPVYLAPHPQASAFKFTVKVKVGHRAEDQRTQGISHLLEHYLFTDARLDESTTYLELIKERQGRPTGTTSNLLTTYSATIPSKEALWLVEAFEKMLLDRTFDNQQIERIKKPVFVEIGEVKLLDRIKSLGFDYILDPPFLSQGGFWNTEFGIDLESRRQRVRINTERFRANDLDDWYRAYYQPQNITIFVSGKFDSNSILKKLAYSFGQMAPTSDLRLMPLFNPRPRNAKYMRNVAFGVRPEITLGTKFWNLTADDSLILRIYFEHLAHRLTKEVRNQRGGSYSPRPNIKTIQNFGYAAIVLDSLKSDFDDNLKKVNDYINDEAFRGNFSREKYQEAIELYRGNFFVPSFSPGFLESAAESWARNRFDLGSEETDFQIYQRMNYEQFRERLKALFPEDRRAVKVDRPPVLFEHELEVFLALMVLSLFVVAGKTRSRAFRHAGVRMIRKFATPPLYLFEAFTVAVAIFVGNIVNELAVEPFFRLPLAQQSILVSTFLSSGLKLIVFVVFILFALRFIKKKFTVCDDFIFIKSASFPSRMILLSQIKKIELIRLWSFLFSARVWKVKFRSYYYNPLIWRPGIYLELHSGQAYFCGLKDSKGAVEDMSVFLDRTKSIDDNLDSVHR